MATLGAKTAIKVFENWEGHITFYLTEAVASQTAAPKDQDLLF